jgi:hypothetical protein
MHRMIGIEATPEDPYLPRMQGLWTGFQRHPATAARYGAATRL